MTSLTLNFGKKSTPDAAIQEWLKNPIHDPLHEIDQALSSYKEVLPENLYERAKQLLDQAEYFLAKTDHPYLHPPSFFRELFELLISFVEMVFDVFGAQKLFGSPEHEWQEEQKSFKLMNLISFVGMISTQVLPLLGMEDGQKKVAVVLTAIMGLSLIYPRIQPTPRNLPRGQNLTRAIEKGDVEILEGDKKVLDLMAAALKNQKKVMLVGPSGVGKTETAKAFVEAVIRGDYPELQGTFAFYYNTADIVDHFGGNMIGRIQDVAGRNLHNMLFIWDEFHVACKGQLADQMKTLFDRGPRSLPFAIVITTDEEAKTFEETNQGALVRRFEKIHLHRPTDEEIGSHLPDLLLRKMPEAMIENPKDTFQYLITQCKEKLPSEKFIPYQVHNAIEVLKLCFEYLGESQYKRPDEGMLKEQEQMRLALASSVIGSLPVPLDRKKPAPIKQENEEEKRAFFLRRKQMLAVKRALYEVGRTLAKASKPRNHDLKKFHLIQKVLPLMERELIEQANKLGLKTMIDQALIDQAIEEILARRTQKVDAND